MKPSSAHPRITRQGDLLSFQCPGCGEEHTVRINSAERPSWTWNGDVERPTLTPSVLNRSGHYLPDHQGEGCWCTYNEERREAGESEAPFRCRQCHSFVRDGRIEFLKDCSHDLAGQTVDLPEIP